MSVALSFRQWVKAGDTPLAKLIYKVGWGVRRASMPSIPAIHKPLYMFHCAVRDGLNTLVMALWFKPLFLSQMTKPAKELHLFGKGMPYMAGPLKLSMGDRCRLSTQCSLLARVNGNAQPELIIGNNVGIGWQTHIAVGSKIVLEDDVRMGGRNLLSGFPGHPLDPVARARGDADTDDQVGDIIIEQGAWLGMGVAVTAGVTIGRGTVVATNSVVTKDLPANVLAGGVPARVIRPLFPNESKAELTGQKEKNNDA